MDLVISVSINISLLTELDAHGDTCFYKYPAAGGACYAAMGHESRFYESTRNAVPT